MDEEKKSLFDGFETDEETGEVIIPRASVGVVRDEVHKENDAEGEASQDVAYIPVELDAEELPELQFDFEFGEEEFADPAQDEAEEETILQSIDEALAAQMTVSLGPVEETVTEKKPRRKSVWNRIPLWLRIAMITLGTLCLSLVLLVGTKPGRKIIYSIVAEYIAGEVTRPEDITPAPTTEPNTQNPNQPTKAPVNQGEDKENPDKTDLPVREPRKEDYVYNILLVGEESLPQFAGSRSDTMILISVNSRDKKIGMTSLMRDMYVEIPGYSDHKLNAAYSYGGMPLLIDTIELNLRIKIDGYVKVGFDSFEWIVDRLGGVEITLTAEEAAYLRKTDYISNPAYRNVVAGNQLMNGNQVLGYCRVRYVPTANGTYSDFGRTERQRTVLTKIFNSYKNEGVLKLLSLINDCLPRVTTDISKEDMQKLLENVVENRILTLESFRVPVKGMFESARLGEGIGEVIIVHWESNIKELYSFVFGDKE